MHTSEFRYPSAVSFLKLRPEVMRALEAGGPSAALDVFEAHRELLDDDPDLAAAYLDLLQHVPTHKTLVADVETVLSQWPTEPRLVNLACSALLAAVDRVPPDEPADDLATRCADAATTALSSMDESHALWPFLQMNLGNALRRCGPERDAEAQTAMGLALEARPERGWWWFNLGLLHKWRGRHAECLDATERAKGRLGAEKPILWNIALAATALGDGPRAVSAWKQLGLPARLSKDLKLTEVEGLPPLAVRIPSRSDGYTSEKVPDRSHFFELVWVQPFSPVHGIVITPTFRDAPVDHGDMIIWDGAPVAMTSERKEPTPVFPLLEILSRGEGAKLPFIALQQRAGAALTLLSALPGAVEVFEQAEQVVHACSRCASGDVLTKHEHEPPSEHRVVRGKVIASPEHLAAMKTQLEAEVRRLGDVSVAIPKLYETLGETRDAGRHHQAWKGIERVGMKSARG